MIVQIWLQISNALVCFGWLRLFKACVEGTSHESQMTLLTQAIALGCLEFINAVLKLTRSKPHLTFLFTAARASIALKAIPSLRGTQGSSLPVQQATLFAIVCWCTGESVRFSMMFLAGLNLG